MDKEFRKMNLQLFADGDGKVDDKAGKKQEDLDEDEDDEAGDEDGDEGSSSGKGKKQKTFTSEQLRPMMAKEKRDGRKSVLNALGVKSIEEAIQKIGSSSNPKTDSSGKDDGKGKSDDEALRAERDATRKALERATYAERKSIALESGCKKDYLDDVIAIAARRVNDDKDFEEVIEEVKKSHSFFFVSAKEDDGSDDSDSSDKKGTGKGADYKKKSGSNTAGSYGKKLAEKKVQTGDKKNPFFD